MRQGHPKVSDGEARAGFGAPTWGPRWGLAEMCVVGSGLEDGEGFAEFGMLGDGEFSRTCVGR